MSIMTPGLQISMIAIAVIAIIAVLWSAIRTKLDVRFAIFWIFWSLLILITGIFPSIAKWFAELLGIQTVSNFVFLVMIGILFCVSYYSFIRMSKMNEEIKKLTYEVAVLKEK